MVVVRTKMRPLASTALICTFNLDRTRRPGFVFVWAAVVAFIVRTSTSLLDVLSLMALYRIFVVRAWQKSCR